MTLPSQHTSIITQAQFGVRRNVPVILGGVAGASTIALLAVSSVMAPAIAGGVSLAALTAWLGGLGGNALAGWLTAWAEANLARFDGQDPEYERKLIGQLARDLSAQLAAGGALAGDVDLVLRQTEAIRVALDALDGQGDRQLRLLQLLLQDLQSARVENNQLHDATYRAVGERAQTILDAQAQGDAALANKLREVLAALAKVEAAASRPTTVGGISIGGNVGTFQPVNISGGTVSGPIIGSQHTYYGAQPAASQDAIEDAESDLAIQRAQASKLRRRVAQGDLEAAQGLAEARAEIRRLKGQLRAQGRQAADEPGDEG